MNTSIANQDDKNIKTYKNDGTRMVSMQMCKEETKERETDNRMERKG